MIGKIMKQFRNKLLKDLYYPPVKVSLGRWNVDDCEKKIHTKIDNSNEDHCGSCKNQKHILIVKKQQDEEEEYMKYFIV